MARSLSPIFCARHAGRMSLRYDDHGAASNILLRIDRDGYKICVRRGGMVGQTERGNLMQRETWEVLRHRVLTRVAELPP